MRSLGVVRGIILPSRSLVGNIGASLKTVFGGSITIYTKLYEKARYDATEIADGVPRSVGLRHGRLRRAISPLKNAKQAGLGTNKEQNQTILAAGQLATSVSGQRRSCAESAVRCDAPCDCSSTLFGYDLNHCMLEFAIAVLADSRSRPV